MDFIDFLKKQLEIELSKTKFAELMEVERGTVYRWIEGKHKMKPKDIRRAIEILAKYKGIDPEPWLKELDPA